MLSFSCGVKMSKSTILLWMSNYILVISALHRNNTCSTVRGISFASSFSSFSSPKQIGRVFAGLFQYVCQQRRRPSKQTPSHGASSRGFVHIIINTKSHPSRVHPAVVCSKIFRAKQKPFSMASPNSHTSVSALVLTWARHHLACWKLLPQSTSHPMGS